MNSVTAIQNSGHHLSHRIYKKLITAGWSTSISSRYIDDISGVAREIDVVGTKYDHVVCGEKYFVVRAKIVIECKYNRGKPWVVFLTNNDPADEDGLGMDVGRMSFTYPEKTFYDNWAGLYQSLTPIIPVKYFTPEVGVLSVPNENGTEKEIDKDPFFVSTSGVIKTIKFIKEQYNDTEPDFEIFFPIVVTSHENHLFSLEKGVDIGDASFVEQNVETSLRFLAKINYLDKTHDDEAAKKQKWFETRNYIDIVAEEKFDEVLSECDETFKKFVLVAGQHVQEYLPAD